MAEFQGIFCHPFLPSVLIIEGVGGMDGMAGWAGVGWVGLGGRWQKPPFGAPHEQPWCQHCGQCHNSGPRSQLQVPTAQLAPSMGAIVPAVSSEGRQNALHKSRPVNVSHLIHCEWIYRY